MNFNIGLKLLKRRLEQHESSLKNQRDSDSDNRSPLTFNSVSFVVWQKQFNAMALSVIRCYQKIHLKMCENCGFGLK